MNKNNHPSDGIRISLMEEGSSGLSSIHQTTPTPRPVQTGTLLTTCTDYRSAQRIVARIRRMELAWFQEQSYQDFILLEATDRGVVMHTFEPVPGYHTNHFPTLGDAEAYIQKSEHIFENGKCVGYGMH